MTIGGLTGCTSGGRQQASTVEAAPSAAEIVLACKGKVEGRSETIEVGAAADGVIKAIYVEEGQTVRKGTRVAEIDCSDLEASLPGLFSESEGLRQARVRLLRGSRDQERQIAAEKTAAASAVLQRARLNLERMKELFEKNDVSRSAFDDARRNFQVADAEFREATRHEELVKAPPLAEDVARLDAEISAAEYRVAALRQKIAKCAVLAPIDGTILRIFLRAGESFSTVMPRPVLAVADTSTRRVRAEIDERDVLKVRRGQRVTVFSESQPEHRYSGTVERLGASLGHKRILANDPSEQSDQDVLEAMIDLERPAMDLPVGLRVVVHFLK
jgi:HlyD family secretion protein